MRTIPSLTAAVTALLIAGCASIASAPSQEERQALAPTGKLRVALERDCAARHMKRLTIAGVAVVAICVAALGLRLWLLRGDVIENRYPTLESARAAYLFERGWLPDVLPPSSSRNGISNNLHLNRSWGSFEFLPNEWTLFEAELSPGNLNAPFVDWELTAAKRLAGGFYPWHRTTAGSSWVFFCRPTLGRCEYFRWLTRES